MIDYGDLTPHEVWDIPGNYHAVFKFDNGYGAGVICNHMSYGNESGLFEVGVISARADWSLDYDTPITIDALGWLTGDEVIETLQRIKALT
jgi:hypothetical protein